ncbi:unnamed protein product, partial [Rangifer tarandus platyrhynchus]
EACCCSAEHPWKPETREPAEGLNLQSPSSTSHRISTWRQTRAPSPLLSSCCVIIHIDLPNGCIFMVDCSSYQCERIALYLCTPFHYVIYIAQLRSNSKEGLYILAHPFHLQQTINKPKGLQQQQASITHPSCGSSHLAQDSESTSGAALCYSGLFSSPPEGVST